MSASRWRAWSLVQKFYKSVFSGTPCRKIGVWKCKKSRRSVVHKLHWLFRASIRGRRWDSRNKSWWHRALWGWNTEEAKVQSFLGAWKSDRWQVKKAVKKKKLWHFVFGNLREDLNLKKTFSFGHCPNKGGGVYPCPNFFALFQEVHFWSLKRVYFFKNANVLNF